MMAEVVEVQSKLPVLFRAHDLAKLVDKPRAAVRREAHDFYIVAVVRKAEKLRRRCVDDSDRMWIFDLSGYLDVVALPRGPHRRDEVAEAVDRQQRGAFERRNIETACEMRTMMFDVVKLRSDSVLRDVQDTRHFGF